MFWPFKKKHIVDAVEDVKPRTHADEFPFKEGQFVPNASDTRIVSSDAQRVSAYVASGQEIVDLSNKPRIPNDGFASDGELMQPFNRAHTGTKKGLSDLMKGGRR